VENTETGPLTICQSCGEVLAESWALGDAVTDIIDGAEWLKDLRNQGGLPNSPLLIPGSPAIVQGTPASAPPLQMQPTPADDYGTIPGLIGPDTAVSMDSLMSELRGTIGERAPAFDPSALPPDMGSPPFAGSARSASQSNEGNTSASASPLTGRVREINPARTAVPKSISSELPLAAPTLIDRRLVLVPLTSPGVQSAVRDLIQGTGAEMRKESIDSHPILAIHGLDAAAAFELRQRLERVGIPAKVRDADPLSIEETSPRMRFTPRQMILLAVLAGMLLAFAIMGLMVLV
jgi:hypothetical protein